MSPFQPQEAPIPTTDLPPLRTTATDLTDRFAECGPAGGVPDALAHRRVFLQEVAPKEPLPVYQNRRSARRDLEARYGRDIIVVFTDSSHSVHIWSARVRCGAEERYIEHRVPPRFDSLLRDFQLSSEPPEGSVDEFRVSTLRLGVYEHILNGTRPRNRRTAENLVGHIQDSASIHELRAIWRSLREFGVLDLASEGDWLVMVARVLEPLYLACIDRMRAWIDDEALARSARRPRYLSDFKCVVEQTENPAIFKGPVDFARRSILLDNIHGLANDRATARQCRRVLLEYANLLPERLGWLDSNVRFLAERGMDGWGMGEGLTSRCAALRQSKADSCMEEAIVLAEARAQLLDRRRCGEPSNRGLRRAAAHLEFRRRALSRRVAELESGRGGSRHTRLRIEFLRLGRGPAFRLMHSVGE